MSCNLIFLALLMGAQGQTSAPTAPPTYVTPVQKVIALITDMKTAAVTEGQTEGSAYAEYSCFCKTTTGLKSKALVDGKDAVVTLSATIEADTATKNTESAELLEREKAQEQNQKALAASKADCAAKKATYEANEAEVAKAIYGVSKAIESLENTKPSLLQVQVPADVVEIVAMADAMGMIRPKHKAVSEFLQSKGKSAFLQQKVGVDPTDPTYKYHSDDIISLCKELKKDFEDQKKVLDDKDKADSKACSDMQSALNSAITSNDAAMSALEGSIAGLESKISTDLQTLQTTETGMVEDKAYLKDLTKQCEDRANDWDQRSALRKAEIETLAEALSVLETTVKSTDAFNVRALLQKTSETSKSAVNALPVKAVVRAISFLQGASESHMGAALSSEQKRDLALLTLRKEGQRLHSVALQTLSVHAAADPFMKVKELIQKLIERLVAESAAEAEKKGYCDTTMSKLKQDRKYRYDDTIKLNAEIAELEAKRDSLSAEMKTLKNEINATKEALQTATDLRAADKAANVETLDQANTGLAALKECIDLLETFYRKSARATVLAQVSPVDEDTSGPGFTSAYKGQQVRSVAVLDLLQVIKSDYERTIKTTTAAEAEAHADFTEFKKVSESDISGKTKKYELDEEDHATTLATIESKMGDLTTARDLLDKALMELAALNPMCVDSGMSYADRKSTREEEITALTTALCQLDAEKVEEECQK
mmetsp:Transcript_68031/g.125479  ORF Transcript_68031/g.125479 Transcript_68031/m.125479 type:complete len:715 (+) Transcript_68031:82-2226(+)